MRNDFIKKLITDIKVELSDEFDRNFERKGFFNKKWSNTTIPNQRGSLMMRSGALRRSITATISNNRILYKSSLPYASIHNEGGEMEVTKKMKRFFWAMYYKTSGAIPKNSNNKNSIRNNTLTQEAKKWKSLALLPLGHVIKIEQRQFIGDHPKVKEVIATVTQNNLKHINEHFIKHVKKS